MDERLKTRTSIIDVYVLSRSWARGRRDFKTIYMGLSTMVKRVRNGPACLPQRMRPLRMRLATLDAWMRQPERMSMEHGQTLKTICDAKASHHQGAQRRLFGFGELEGCLLMPATPAESAEPRNLVHLSLRRNTCLSTTLSLLFLCACLPIHQWTHRTNEHFMAGPRDHCMWHRYSQSSCLNIMP